MARGLVVASVAPAATAVWAVVQLVNGAEPAVVELVWVEGLDLAVRFRFDSLALLMTLLVSGIGALVFVYAAGYFSPTRSRWQPLRRFAAGVLDVDARSGLGRLDLDAVHLLGTHLDHVVPVGRAQEHRSFGAHRGAASVDDHRSSAVWCCWPACSCWRTHRGHR